MSFPALVQQGRYDCGPTCLRMVAQYYGKVAVIRTDTTGHGVSLAELKRDGELSGFEVRAVRCPDQTVIFSLPLPAIAHWIEKGRQHWIVVAEIVESQIYIADPGWPFGGLRGFSFSDFKQCWDGVLMLLSPKAC